MNSSVVVGLHDPASTDKEHTNQNKGSSGSVKSIFHYLNLIGVTPRVSKKKRSRMDALIQGE